MAKYLAKIFGTEKDKVNCPLGWSQEINLKILAVFFTFQPLNVFYLKKKIIKILITTIEISIN